MRPERDLAREDDRRRRLPRPRRGRRAARVRAVLPPAELGARPLGRARRPRYRRHRHAPRRDRRRQPRARAVAAPALPTARDPGRDRRRGRERRRESCFLPRVSRPLRRGFCDSVVGQL